MKTSYFVLRIFLLVTHQSVYPTELPYLHREKVNSKHEGYLLWKFMQSIKPNSGINTETEIYWGMSFSHYKHYQYLWITVTKFT